MLPTWSYNLSRRRVLSYQRDDLFLKGRSTYPLIVPMGRQTDDDYTHGARVISATYPGLAMILRHDRLPKLLRASTTISGVEESLTGPRNAGT